MIESAQQYVMDRFSSGVNDSWIWFNTLTREEWLVVLAVTCACGFLIIRGFGTRKQF